ncbi:hypothetical protein [Microbacterium oleivorans]|uniref:Uncharacterized protein n=1 Tax=Microbacterium oleivorans TaxID=273677 RepID=A0A7D5IV36_9MICO|nr:hypothetical protein [Microbacterium oleivorans]QLD10882.1 hypothetical protein HW566_03240 [Microbacterium oleivorans]
MSDRIIAATAWSIAGAVSTVLAVGLAYAAELVRAGIAVLAVFGGGAS